MYYELYTVPLKSARGEQFGTACEEKKLKRNIFYIYIISYSIIHISN